MTAPISTEQATVFRATWKGVSVRRFTKRSAIEWLAWRMIETNPRWQCFCEGGDYVSGDPGIVCDFHRGKADALQKRMVRYLKFLDKQSRTEVSP